MTCPTYAELHGMAKRLTAHIPYDYDEDHSTHGGELRYGATLRSKKGALIELTAHVVQGKAKLTARAYAPGLLPDGSRFTPDFPRIEAHVSWDRLTTLDGRDKAAREILRKLDVAAETLRVEWELARDKRNATLTLHANALHELSAAGVDVRQAKSQPAAFIYPKVQTVYNARVEDGEVSMQLRRLTAVEALCVLRILNEVPA
jgi:hypothetical protein